MLIWQPTGAQLLSLSSPLFYLGPHLQANKPARGGVPVLFPQFADKGRLQKHGYARNTPWVLEKEERTGNKHLLQLCLDVEPITWPDWPYAARLELLMDAAPGCLDMTLRVINTGDATFEFTGGLHPYFEITDPARFKLIGLKGCPVEDKLDLTLKREPLDGPVVDGLELERLYLSAPAVQLEGSPLGKLDLSCSGFTNWMVWNPGTELAKGIADLPDADWARFVCVEPVIAHKPLSVEAGGVFEGTLTCRWSESTGQAKV